MDTLLTGMVDWKEKKVYVNGFEMEPDELGGFTINVTKILTEEEKMPGLDKFLIWLEQRLTIEQVKALYQLLGKSRTITITDAAYMAQVGKSAAKEIINEGIRCGVLCKSFNSAYKPVDKMMRERIEFDYAKMNEVNKPRRNAEDILHEKMDTWKKEREENEQSDNMSESISEEESEEPAQIKVGMKGESKRTGKGTVKSMSELAKQQTPSLVILPKKKPLQSPTQAPKKSHKPAKT